MASGKWMASGRRESGEDRWLRPGSIGWGVDNPNPPVVDFSTKGDFGIFRSDVKERNCFLTLPGQMNLDVPLTKASMHYVSSPISPSYKALLPLPGTGMRHTAASTAGSSGSRRS